MLSVTTGKEEVSQGLEPHPTSYGMWFLALLPVKEAGEAAASRIEPRGQRGNPFIYLAS